MMSAFNMDTNERYVELLGHPQNPKTPADDLMRNKNLRYIKRCYNSQMERTLKPNLVQVVPLII